MTKKQANGKRQMDSARRIIDRCDAMLLDVLQQRGAAAAVLAEIKGEGPVLRPAREAAIYRRLLDRLGEQDESGLSGEALLALWRHVIGASLALQGGVRFYFCERQSERHGFAQALAYSAGQNLTMLADGEALLGQLREDKRAVGLVPSPASDEKFWQQDWWVRLPSGIAIVARWPFVPNKDSGEVWIISSDDGEGSGNDIELAAGHEGEENKIGRAGEIIARAGGYFLASFSAGVPQGFKPLGGIALPQGAASL